MCSVPDPDEEQLSRVVRQVVGRAMGLPQPEADPAPAPDPKTVSPDPKPAPAPGPERPRVIAIGSDHGGFELKEILKADLAAMGYKVSDVGTHGKDPVDYPDYAHEVARFVRSGLAWRGIMIDGAGIGSCIVANKVPGIRAGMAYDQATAVNSREHNDTNVLTLGAGLIGAALARQIVKTWLATEFGGGRHARRVQKITDVEVEYLK
jgi:ribose 5-phosphate isomerase B